MASGKDRISGLPDELLHAILARLRSARAAVRTCVLSRRWRHVLGPLPELVLEGRLDAPPPPAASFLDTIDAAVAACDRDAPALGRFSIALSTDDRGLDVQAGRVAPWLRFASERVVGAFSLVLPPPDVDGEGEEEEAVLELPACEGATAIHLSLEQAWRLRPPSAGLFRALTDLSITYGRMEGSELTALVCTRCPCLMDLKLSTTLVNSYYVSIRSESLHSLRFCVSKTRRLEVVTPRMEKLYISLDIDNCEVRISAPKLAELACHHQFDDPCRYQFDDVGRRLRMLELSQSSVWAPLMQRFDEVDKLYLIIAVLQGIAEYERFFNETNKLPMCRTLKVSLSWRHHSLASGLLHLLRCFNSTEKVSILLINSSDFPMCPQSCLCCSEESHRIDDIALDSLEDLEFISYTISNEVLEFLEQLARCNPAILKKVVIKHMPVSPPPTKEVCETIRSIFQLNVEVELYYFSDGRLVRL